MAEKENEEEEHGRNEYEGGGTGMKDEKADKEEEGGEGDG